MSNQQLFLREMPQGIAFKVFIQPRSSKNRIIGLHGDALKIALTAPPVDNAANKMCIGFLAKSLNVSKSSLEIISGHTSRTKQIMLKSQNEPVSSPEKEKMRSAVNQLLDTTS